MSTATAPRTRPPLPNGRNGAPAPQTSAAPGGHGRDERGRFQAGNPGGPGNPHGRRVAALRQAFLAEVTEDRMRQLAARLYLLAMDGDVQAARLVLAYVIGKPVDAVDPDRLDADEARLRSETRYQQERLKDSDELDREKKLVEQLDLEDELFDDEDYSEFDDEDDTPLPPEIEALFVPPRAAGPLHPRRVRHAQPRPGRPEGGKEVSVQDTRA